MTQPPCPGFETLLERFADGEGDAEESLRVREHLSACAPCRIGLRSITELNRRVAQSPPPPVPPDLEARIRRALRRADRPFRRWVTPVAAAAVLLLAATAFLLRPLPASAKTLPAFVAGGAIFHGRYLSSAPAFKPGDQNELRDYFRRALDTDIVMPEFDRGNCKERRCTGGCPCANVPEAVPWILYTRGGTAVSLIIAPAGDISLPEHARRSRDGRDYHVFDVRGAAAIARASGSRICLWIARLPEEELFRCILQTTEGREAFSGAPVSSRIIICRACCGRLKWGPVTSSSNVEIKVMYLLAAGKKGIDLDLFIREGQEP